LRNDFQPPLKARCRARLVHNPEAIHMSEKSPSRTLAQAGAPKLVDSEIDPPWSRSVDPPVTSMGHRSHLPGALYGINHGFIDEMVVQEAKISEPDHTRLTAGCSGSSQQTARRARPRESSTRRSKLSINTWTAGLNFVRSRGWREEPQRLRRAATPLRAPWTWPKSIGIHLAFDIQTLYGDLLAGVYCG
jgi:hypothetical protein